MSAKKKTFTQKYRPGNAGASEENPPFILITVENNDELRRAIVRDVGDMWTGWAIDAPAMLSVCYPKFAWRLVLQRSFDRADYPPETCTCNEFDKELYGEREEGQHHKWCPYNPIRELAKL